MSTIIDIIAYIIGCNALIYLGVHLPLDIITQLRADQKTKEGAKDYPPWQEGKQIIKIITVITSLLFWAFFILWPPLHLLNWDGFILLFSFNIPVIGLIIHYIGLVLLSLGTVVAIAGRISRGIQAISWGVPKDLTTKGAYSIVRHPLYSSYCLYFLGFPLALQNYLLIPLAFGIIGYYFTAKYEEKILVNEFGEEYKIYQRKVGMLVPFLGRRKAKEKSK
jgi:protein-S-isoprenylcysteine O-methyltransferase Ste14